MMEPLFTCLAFGLAMVAPGLPSTPSSGVRIADTQQSFSSLVVKSLSAMPRGGGYSVRRNAAEALSRRAVVWKEADGLKIAPQMAQPSFCSEACYLVLLLALREWEQREKQALPAAFWKAARVDLGQPDGLRAWGRVNANGPGIAKWVHDLGAGVNFTDPNAARPGDFLKIFWTREIGQKEFGHLVVFLGIEKGPDGPALRFWSSNKPGGYGEKTVPLAKTSRLLFTRITRPDRFGACSSLPEKDLWLAAMQKKHFSFDEVRRACGVRSAPTTSEDHGPDARRLRAVMGNDWRIRNPLSSLQSTSGSL